MIRDLTKAPYRAGLGGDDSDRLQAAVDDGGYHPLASAADQVGNNIYLPGGAYDGTKKGGGTNYRRYKITKPIKIRGNTKIYGDLGMSCIDARAIPKGRAVFEFEHVSFDNKSWWQSNNVFRDLRIESGGHAFASDMTQMGHKPEHEFDPAVWQQRYTCDNLFENLELVTAGGGLYFPYQYSQGNIVNNIYHRNPCYTGLALWGNFNKIDHYRMVAGRGAWIGDNTIKFNSPWFRDQFGKAYPDEKAGKPGLYPDDVDPRRMGCIDIRGYGNSLRMNHVEFGPSEPITGIVFTPANIILRS